MDTHAPLLLFKRQPGQTFSPAPVTTIDDSTGDTRIRCPHCQWQPDAKARWGCVCGHEWHTFDTGGVCPACHVAWTDTQCLRCEQWSPHAAWYDTGPPRA